MLIDTHAHINMLENPELAIIDAKDAGVSQIIIPSASEDDFEKILDLCHRFEDVYALLGADIPSKLITCGSERLGPCRLYVEGEGFIALARNEGRFIHTEKSFYEVD